MACGELTVPSDSFDDIQGLRRSMALVRAVWAYALLYASPNCHWGPLRSKNNVPSEALAMCSRAHPV